MFKRLRERIAEEATKFPVGQLNNTPGKQPTDLDSNVAAGNSTEDLITLSDSSSVVVPHTSSQQFSIGEDEDGSSSLQSTPQKSQNESANGSTNQPVYYSHGTRDHDLSFGHEYRPTKSNYVPQSDIESEREEPPTLNLESISKDQLMNAIELLKARVHKYKNKYSEVVKNFKEIREEKLKIENTLIETQDKAVRRMAELREQCQLEQKAKAHLEANLRILLEEKDSRITVLETQNNLLKENGTSMNSKTFQDSDGLRSEDSLSTCSQDSSLQYKVERLDHQLSQAKKTITSQTDQITLLRKQNESLSQELEEKVQKLNEMEEEVAKLKSKHEFIVQSLQSRMKELELQQEESVMSMAETKKNMHEEMELKEKQLAKAEEEAKLAVAASEIAKAKLAELQQHFDDKTSELQRQIESTEKMLEEEKENLMQELNRGKTAAIALVKQECDKKVLAVEEEWKRKFDQFEKEKHSKENESEDSTKNVRALEEELKPLKEQTNHLNSIIENLKRENADLKSSLEKTESDNADIRHDESVKCLKDKLQNAEANLALQVEEMKLKIVALQQERDALQEDLSRSQQLKESLKVKEDELQLKAQASCKEQAAKLQEKMKDKENMIVKLKADIEAVRKEAADKAEEARKKVKLLEAEREQLMIQAQERVAKTESKCREDVTALQDKNSKLLSEVAEMEKLNIKINLLEKELSSCRTAAESNEAAAQKEISSLKDRLSEAETRLSEAESSRQVAENEFSSKLKALQDQNTSLLDTADHLESLKSEKEELNEKLKQAEQQVVMVDSLRQEVKDLEEKLVLAEQEVSSFKMLETERDSLKSELATISKDLESLKSLQSDNDVLQQKVESLEESLKLVKSELEAVKSGDDRNSSQADVLRAENEKLQRQIKLLEQVQSFSSEDSALKEYVGGIREECEAILKAKDEEMHLKLKQLVKDVCIQMDVKDKDCDRTISELLDKSYSTEERLLKEHRKEVSELRQNLFEKECALDEMRDNYEEKLQEKEKKLKELHLTVKKLSEAAGNSLSCNDVAPLSMEGSDWDDTWAVPEESVENASPSHVIEPCKDHLEQIQTLQNEITKCNSEIKELKLLLRLSPPDAVSNNNMRDSMASVPEPTEFEYLKNIIYEYMMGKEPITLAKVIAAVLRFDDTQTKQVIRREESRHTTR